MCQWERWQWECAAMYRIKLGHMLPKAEQLAMCSQLQEMIGIKCRLYNFIPISYMFDLITSSFMVSVRELQPIHTVCVWPSLLPAKQCIPHLGISQ